jgi:hypothetical protein
MRPHTSGFAAWALVVLTAALVPAAVVLVIVGAHRGLDIPDDAGSRPLLVGLGGAVALCFGAMGFLLARRLPRNAIGWIFLVAAAMLAAMVAAFAYADLAVIGGERWPGAAWVAWFANWSLAPPAFITPCLVAQLYPDGRPLPGRWRPLFAVTLAVATAATLASMLVAGPIDSYRSVDSPVGAPHALAGLVSAIDQQGGVLLAPPVLIASLAALVARWRRSRGIERQQMKWLLYSGALPVTGFSLSFVLGAVVGEGLLVDAVFVTAFASLMLIPASVAVAILRHRLYEIDRVISRTLVYAALTVVLGAAYAGLVLAGQAVFSAFAGGGNLAIAVSTLVVAALFLPLRGRVQQLVDRRFYRRRYDAQRTLEAFGARLREEIDLRALGDDLRRVVTETMQPAHLSLWLRSGS